MKALVVLSGGMDSATALALACSSEMYDSIETITFNYGSKHNDRENQCAAKLAAHYGVKNTVVKMPFINELFKSDLLQSGGEIPEGHYADPSMKRTVVPFRNGIMLSIAAGFAESIGASVLILGNHAGDHAIYPDCREEFTAPMSAAIKAGTYAGVEIVRPFEKETKTGLCKLGGELNVPYELTHSCYVGDKKACGKCGTCLERVLSFYENGLIDPIEYHHGWKETLKFCLEEEAKFKANA